MPRYKCCNGLKLNEQRIQVDLRQKTSKKTDQIQNTIYQNSKQLNKA